MALLETKMIVSNILRKYIVHPVKDKQITFDINFILTLKDDEVIYLTERN